MKFLLAAVFGLASLAFAPLAAHAEIREYNLTISRQAVTVDGKTSEKITVNGAIPGPVLQFTEGDEAVIHVTNAMTEDTSIHWHGMIVPGDQDGAPGFNGFDGIRPGQTFTYRFPVRQSGTYWYHSHSAGQEQDGLYGAIVIAPKGGDPIKADRDYVVLLSDYSQESSGQILGNLKKSSDYYQWHRRTLGDVFADAGRMGLSKAVDRSAQWGKMRMLPTDLADVAGYRFLVNGQTPDQNWTGLFQPGQRVRLRIINAGAMTMFDVRIPGLRMTVVAADGQPVVPVPVDEFRIGNAETYDVIVEPQDDRAYTLVAEPIDRTGFALGTLAPRQGMRGEMPVQRPRARLTMADMNMEAMMKDDPNMDMSAMDEPSGWARTGAPEGAKVLDYSDLESLAPQADTRDPTRDITVRLGGNMNRYIWTMNGKTFDPRDGIAVAYNERVRITYINETMMAHPIHLHGMLVQLDNGQPMDRLPGKHTVIVPPGQTVSVILTADNAASWPFHCHLFFHMAAGMMTTLTVARPGEAPPPPAKDAMPGMKMDGGNMDGMNMGGMAMPSGTGTQDKGHDHAH